jgi:ribose 5-phosphate isomerase B
MVHLSIPGAGILGTRNRLGGASSEKWPVKDPAPTQGLPRYNLSMKIAIGSDHAGFELKEKIKSELERQGFHLTDAGTSSTDSVDYPDFARAVGESVASGQAERGILVCGSGIGMAIAANKVAGVRAANVRSELEAQLSREHNDANVLALGARILGEESAFKIIETWLKTAFTGGRHQRRVEKIGQLEQS